MTEYDYITTRQKKEPFVAKVSIVMGCFNEEETIMEIVKRVLSQNCVLELIVVDDNSTDSSYKKLTSISNKRLKILRNETNSGKGFCIIKGIQETRGNIVGIQDADLEYSPEHYAQLIKPIVEGRADVVYGTRFQFRESTRLVYYWHFIANKILTNLCNIFTNLNMSDMETGSKFFTKQAIDSVNLQEKRFGIEPEITIKLAAKRFRFYEVPISYDGRTYQEGKKISAKDGIYAIFAIFKYGLYVKLAREYRVK